MRETPTSLKSLIAIMLSTTLILSCQRPAEIPFPEEEFGYEFPETKPFQMPEPKSFIWKDIDPDSVTISKVVFDIDKLPSIAFSLNEFKPLKKPLDVQPLDWDNLTEFPLNLDTITARPLIVKHSILQEPVISEISEALVPNTTSGIISIPLEKGQNGVSTAGLVLDNNNFVWQANRKNLIKIVGNRFYSYPLISEIKAGEIIGLSKDSLNNLWVSTTGEGVFRINLRTHIITQYNLPEGFPNFIYSVEPDPNGFLWISSIRDAIYILDPDTETIKRLPIQELEGNPENSPLSIKKDRNNNLWIGNRMDVSIISPDRKIVKKINIENGLTEGLKIGFFEAKDGNMWIGSINSPGAQAISLTKKTLTTLGKEHGLESIGVLYTEDNLNRIWIHSNNSSYVLEPQKYLLKKIQTNAIVAAGTPGSALTDSRGNIWLGSSSTGILFYDPLGPLPEFFTANNGFEGNEFWSSFEDSRGRIWILTYDKVHIYDPVKNELKFIGPEQGLRKGNGSYRHSIDLYNNTIFVGTERGFSLIDIDNKNITNISLQNFPNGIFFSGTQDQQGNMWLGTNFGLVFYNPSTQSVKLLDLDSGLSFNTVYSVKEGKDSRVYVATMDKLNILDPIENKLWQIGEEQGIASNQVLSMLQSGQEDFWLATAKGISIFDKEFQTITNINSKNGLIPDDIYDLTESEENIYAGSGNGLVQIPKNQFQLRKEGITQPFRIFNYANGFGFPYNDFNQNSSSFSKKNGIALYGITPLLAVTTQEPISNPISPEVFITGLDIMDQKTSFKRFSDIVSQVKPGDTLWNASKTDFYLSGSKVVSKDYLAKNKILWDSLSPAFDLPIGLKLPYDQNALHFFFENPDPRSRGSIEYSYILEGYDDAWSNPIPDAKTKSYFNLPSGEYNLKVVTKGFDGIWSEPAEMKFTILPPWWQTWWGYLIFAVIFSGIVWAIVQVRSNILKKENRILEEKVKLRTTQLEKSITDLKSTQDQLIQSEKMASLGELTAGIAHEIQNPLNFVNNFSEVSSELLLEMEEELDKGDVKEAKILSKDIRENLQKIHHHGKRADSIVKGMLQHSRGTTGETKPTNINAMAEEYLRLSFQGFRARDKNFQADFKTEFEEDLPRIAVVRQDFGRVLLNLINNAFYAVNEKAKEGIPGYRPEVALKTKRTDDGIEITISDNGSGIPPEIKDKIFQPFFTTKPTGQGTGLGLSLSYDIVKAHGGEIKVESEMGKGTEFIIQLPIKN